MALKWGFGKKTEKESATSENGDAAKSETANGESPAGDVAGAAGAITERKRIFLSGNGFAARIWGERLKGAGVEFVAGEAMKPEERAKTEFEIIIETDSQGSGAGDPSHAPALADEGIILLPCYSLSPTHAAAELGDLAASSIGYTLFDPPAVAEATEAAPTHVIEIARAMQTSDPAFEKAKAFLSEIGLAQEIVGDAPGLIFGRVWACLVNEAAQAFSEGLASAEDMDAAMRLGVNYPKGLLEWADAMGLELALEILEGLLDHYEEDRYRPAPILRHMLAAKKKFRS